MKVNIAKARAFPDRRSWRSWLRKNYDKEQELWLIYYKKDVGKPTISYDDSVEEALCFGWIDGIIQKIDGERYARRFTPRRARSAWSLANLERIKKLDKLGLLSPAAVVPGSSTKVVPPRQVDLPVPDELAHVLAHEMKARKFFEELAPSYRRLYVRWMLSAKRAETRLRRVDKRLHS